MYLKSLELHGFKSFPNRTVLTFERGATVIVGPNGSGKSNISDAMRWVLGEISSRNIRGNKMEDVIFGGTDTRRPMGFAEVSVTFDNTDKAHRIDSPYDEITVTRRYYRSGDSEYQINRKPCRLKDIHELFMNTGVGREGYSIIGQGRIAEILSRKSEDRRNIFEEAAGISKFRYRKEITEKKLEETQDNMVRLRDILGELESRVGPLEKEAEKARKYLEYYEAKKQADVSLWLYDTEKSRQDLEKAEDAYRLSANELSVLEEALTTLQAQSDRLYEQSQTGKLRSEQLLREIQESTARLNELERAYQLCRNDQVHRRELMEQCRARMNSIGGESGQRDEEIRAYGEKIVELEQKAEQLSADRLEVLSRVQAAEMAAQKLEAELEASLSALTEAEKAATDLSVRMDVLRTNRQSGTAKEQGILQEIASYEKTGEELKAEAERCSRATAAHQAKIDQADEVIRNAETALESLRREKAELAEKTGAMKVERSACLQRAETLSRMEEHFEGYSESIKFVMREYAAGRIGGNTVYGPVSKLIRIESRYITAIETALGGSLQNIVVQDEQTAKAAIAALKRANAGRATFYPLDAIRAGGETEEVRRCASLDGYVGRADKLMDFDQRYREIMEYLLARTVVFDTLDNASAAARTIRYKVKLVTLDGQVINAGGSYTGGSAKRDSGILSRHADIEKLQQKAGQIEEAIRQAEAQNSKLDGQIREKENAVSDAAQRKELLYTMCRAQFQALDSAKAKLEANEGLLARLRGDYTELTVSGSRYEEELQALQNQADQVQEKVAAIRQKRSATDVQRHGILEERDACKEEAAQLAISIAETKKDAENARQSQENCRAQVENLATERENQALRIKEYERELADLQAKEQENRAQAEEAQKHLETLNSDRGTVEENNEEFDRQMQNLRIKTREKTEQKERCSAEHSRNENRLNNLREKQNALSDALWNEHEITYEQAVALNYPPVTEKNRSEVAAAQASAKSRIRALGSVNVSAIEEYADVKARYDDLSNQVGDLNRSCEELSEIVGKIEEEMRESFLSAFTEINRNFGEVFSELFGGGTGELSLTEPEDVLTSGIEIKAAPPGKIIKSLSLLSGGEQAFVAIALFFAILKVNPTPFCILDEIEAALDEVNVFRFGEYIKKFCMQTQFVLITHRRGTMEVADRLYGVTMPERGVSRAIPLDVAEIESKKKELLPDEVSG